MSWVRIHDGAMNHPKILEVFNPRDPFGLWVWGLAYVQLHLTDGFIPEKALAVYRVKSTVDRLVTVGLWDRVDAGYVVHDYLHWNDSKMTITQKRLEAKDRMKNVRDRTRRERSVSERLTENFSRRSSTWSGSLSTNSEKESEEKPSTPKPRPTGRGGTGRVVHRGRAITVFEWMLTELMAMLGAQANDFALDEWFYTLDSMAQNETVVVADRWQWIRERTLEEAQKRGLRVGKKPADVALDAMPRAWECRECGEIHEGSVAQFRAGICLKQAV